MCKFNSCIFSRCIFSPITETNWLINKGVFFYLMFLNIFTEKLTFSKLARKVNFSERKFEEMHWLWRAKGYKVYSGIRLFWHYYFQLYFVYKPCLRFLLNCFVREIKGFYKSSFGNEVDFRDIMNVSLNILDKN